MRFLRRIWARIQAFFIRAAPPPIERTHPQVIPFALEDRINPIGPYQKLEAKESTHVVGMRNPKMTGRTSKTHPGRKGVALTNDFHPALESRRRAEELSDRKAHHAAIHDGRPMLECLECHSLYPAEDLGDHGCDHGEAETLIGFAAGGSATFHNAADNVHYLDVPRSKKGDDDK